jgi:AcrR family transcriptional regulator
VALAKREPASSAPRGEDTRLRLIESALKIFGDYGFAGASTRMLADAAGVNLAAIPYHFGSKEGLYRAAAEFIVENCGKEVLPTIEKIDLALAARKLARTEAAMLLQELLERFAAVVICSQFSDTFAGFVMREQLQPGAAFEILYEGMMRRLAESCAKLLGIALSRRRDDPRILVRAQTVLGQILVFRTSRASIFRQLGWREFSKEQLKVIQSIVAENVERIIAGEVSHGHHHIRTRT